MSVTEADRVAPDDTGTAPRHGFLPLLWALSHRQGLTSTMKAVLVALASYADATGSCWPSIERIAADTRLSDRACQKAIPALEAAGFLSVNRNTGRGHQSVYRLNLALIAEPQKGAPRSPIASDERVHLVHPLPAKRVNLVRVKGEPGSPELLIELPKQAAAKKRASKQVTLTPENPRRSDPPEAWFHLADRNPDGSPKVETSLEAANDRGRPVVAGTYLDVAAELVCEAAKIRNPHWAGRWDALVTWLRDGLDLHQDILPVIRKTAARDGYKPPSASLAYFEIPIRNYAQGKKAHLR